MTLQHECDELRRQLNQAIESRKALYEETQLTLRWAAGSQARLIEFAEWWSHADVYDASLIIEAIECLLADLGVREVADETVDLDDPEES